MFNLRNLFKKKKKKEATEYISMPTFHIDKHYDDMNRRERREYKRWLSKHNMWDGAIVIENLSRNGTLDVKG
jgi:hypothetical protein